MTLQELKDNYAKEQGFLEWEELHMVCQFEGKNLDFAKYIDDVIILAQQEALNRAALSVKIEKFNTRNDTCEYVDGVAGKGIVCTVCLDSITSENNLIK